MNNKLRMRFSKTKRAIYISHLDLMRTMQRAFLRAELPLEYSKGFNPHAQISVLLPLSVGTSSVCELMDFRLEGELDIASVPARLNAVMPEGIEVQEVYEAENKVRDLKWLSVEGVFEYDNGAPEISALESFFAQPEIIITKKTKRGMGESNLKAGIKEISFAPAPDGVAVSAVISAQEPTINPDLLPDALRQLAGSLAPDFAQFERRETYFADMSVFR
jgi:radical SAM-linked protein